MSMLGLTNFIPSSSLSIHSLRYQPQHFSTISITFNSRKPRPLPLSASNNSNSNGVKEEDKNSQQPPSSSGQEEQDKRPLFGLNWSSLLDRDPDNVLALGLTGILTWASVQVLWQLLFISLAILVAALKYSFIAALLIFILIALL
ncbi:hypothetical protein MtrunA17_Chr1g0171461 [Medicago truncatula]|uniref:Transmembrane protein, putative n=1 Tax=Medicago truncatula TaxID=3880 RepID=G7I7V4_MEDTR|nr:uncharacterized protein LOC11419874 [Medicago truncatula]AES60510.1 transmembrane protein, putative [Medicago truncatula]RHN78948.1 hypothetical protein MtrunA17_Chr1g0171461 [Medicago truncatula]